MDPHVVAADSGRRGPHYNALRLSAQHRFAHNFTLLSVYTWSHCLQNAETINNRISLGSNTYQNPYNRDADRAVCDSDLRSSLVTSFVYEVSKLATPVESALLGHWRFSFLTSAHHWLSIVFPVLFPPSASPSHWF